MDKLLASNTTISWTLQSPFLVHEHEPKMKKERMEILHVSQTHCDATGPATVTCLALTSTATCINIV